MHDILLRYIIPGFEAFSIPFQEIEHFSEIQRGVSYTSVMTRVTLATISLSFL